MWKKGLIINAVLFIVAGIVYFCMMSTVSDAGIFQIASIEDLKTLAADIPVKAVDKPEEALGTQIIENREMYLRGLTEESMFVHHTINVFVVEPDTTLEFYNQTYRQDCIVSKVIQGDAVEGEIVSIYYNGGFLWGEQAVYFGNYAKNVMLPGYHYLVFAEKMENQEYLESTACSYKYRCIYTLFNTLNIDSDFSYVLQEEEGYYKECMESEFFVYSEETLEALLEIKHEIMEMYLGEE